MDDGFYDWQRRIMDEQAQDWHVLSGDFLHPLPKGIQRTPSATTRIDYATINELMWRLTND